MSLAQRSPYGHALSTNAGGTVKRAAHSAPSLAALALIASTDPACTHGNEVFVDSGVSPGTAGSGQVWVYSSGSALTRDGVLVEIPSDSPTAGRWILRPGQCVTLRLPIAFGTADAAILLTFPVGSRMKILDLAWEITTGWTGGSSSAIGLSSSTIGSHTTKGDLLGGATGDVAATLVASGTNGYVAGTVGAQMATEAAVRTAVAQDNDTIRFDRITSAFTAGVGYALVRGMLELMPIPAA